MMTNTTTLKRIWFLAGLLLILALSAGQMTVAHAATITVTTTADSGPGSLRQAIADADPGDTIDFGVVGTITLTSGQLSINKNLNIEGPGAANLAIDGSNIGRVFRIIAGTVVISGLTIRNGLVSGSHGGGITNFGTLTLNNSTISGNTARFNGGGIASEGTLILNNSTVSGNSAPFGNGGGIAAGGTLKLNNSTVSGNTAHRGGGITNFDTATLNNSTVTGNAAAAVGGGINNGGATVELKNTIVANNTAGADCSGTGFTSLSYNLDSDGSCSLNAALGDKISANTDLGPLQNNGGPTETHALLAGSEAIDMGDPDHCRDAVGNAVATDQRGFVRPINAICDIGAYEFESHLRIPVGGVTVFSGGSGSSSGSIALLAGGVAAVVAIVSVGGWYTRRRWLSR